MAMIPFYTHSDKQLQQISILKVLYAHTHTHNAFLFGFQWCRGCEVIYFLFSTFLLPIRSFLQKKHSQPLTELPGHKPIYVRAHPMFPFKTQLQTLYLLPISDRTTAFFLSPLGSSTLC